MPIHPYYLGATPAPFNSASHGRPQSMSSSQANLSSPSTRTTSPTTTKATNRQSMPAPARNAALPSTPSQTFDPTPEEEDVSAGEQQQRRPRKGTMSKNFKFPPSSSSDTANSSSLPDPTTSEAPSSSGEPAQHASSDAEPVSHTPLPTIQTSVEVPPPPPVEKERASVSTDIDADVGETEEIPLN